jgi:site-specific DNA-methyltransferase (adenine-specific)
MIEFYNGDALEVMKELKDKGIKVQAVITDPPYGTTSCKWDSVIPLDTMWETLDGISDDTTPIVLFGSEPFSSALRMSNIKNFKYDWIWKKNTQSGFMLAKKQPLRNYEIISVFYKKQPTYNPIFEEYSEKTKQRFKKSNGAILGTSASEIYGGTRKTPHKIDFQRGKYPSNIIEIQTVGNQNGQKLHPSQKPVELMEYLIKTYTNEGDTVLDFTMGSGSTGVACRRLNRNFIGIELDTKYFNVAKERIQNTTLIPSIQTEGFEEW